MVHTKKHEAQPSFFVQSLQLRVIMLEQYLPVQLQCSIPIFLSIEGIAFLFKPLTLANNLLQLLLSLLAVG